MDFLNNLTRKAGEIYNYLDVNILNDILPNLVKNSSVQTTVPVQSTSAPAPAQLELAENGIPTYELMKQYAEQAGATYPDLAAAQFQLESAGGLSPSGTYNYFGVKAGPDESGVLLPTTEYIGGRPVQVNARFKNYNSPQEAMIELVNRWHKDYDGYTGVNAQPTIDAAAQDLYNQSYATDPSYAAKLKEVYQPYLAQTY